MALRGVGYFDSRGQYFKTPDEATMSDLSALLGRVGDGDSLAPGIAKILFSKRREVEAIFADHDGMVQGNLPVDATQRRPVLVSDGENNVARLPTAKPA
jgi:hypothetical protein